MVFLTLEHYNNIKDYLHPNLHSIIKEHLDKENNLFCLLPYHGCYYKNRNETRKLIDYGRGNRCLTPAWNFSWKRNIKKKYFPSNYPLTRYFSNSKYRNLFKNKGNYVYSYNLKVYRQMNRSPLNECYNSMKKYKDALSKKA